VSYELLGPELPLVEAAKLPRVLVQRTRMAMPEPAYAYSVYVAEEEAPEHVRATCTYFSILPEHGIQERFIDFATATRTAAQVAMPTGWARYEAWLEHDQLARREALAVARLAFPELRSYRGDTLPSLWIEMPEYPDGTHAEVWLTFTTRDRPSPQPGAGTPAQTPRSPGSST
jgi:hypothetical protein